MTDKLECQMSSIQITLISTSVLFFESIDLMPDEPGWFNWTNEAKNSKPSMMKTNNGREMMD